MKTFREHMMGGTLRGPLSVILGLGCAFVVWRHWPLDPKREAEILGSIQKGAFVTMAFAVTAYNLRTRVIDLLLKASYKPHHIERLSRTAADCGVRLTWLVVLFTLTSLCMATGAFLDFSPLWSKLAAMTIGAMFIGSLVNFFYVLFAFERLEKFVLDNTIQEAKQKEIDRLTVVSSK